jgi:hypothetical protein
MEGDTTIHLFRPMLGVKTCPGVVDSHGFFIWSQFSVFFFLTVFFFPDPFYLACHFGRFPYIVQSSCCFVLRTDEITVMKEKGQSSRRSPRITASERMGLWGGG